MDQSAVKAIVDREIEPMMEALGVAHWHFKIFYCHIGNDSVEFVTKANCTRMVDYNEAVININVSEFHSEEAVIDSLRHELCHVVLAPYDIVRQVVELAMKDDPVRWAMVESVWTHATEKTVISLNRMRLGLIANTEAKLAIQPKGKKPKRK